MECKRNTASYKFKQNLLKASESQNFEDAILEWHFVDHDTLELGEISCICQHSISHVYYLYNIKTRLTIVVGKDCFKKFGMKKRLLENEDLLCLFRRCIRQMRGEYKTIDDIYMYCNTVQSYLITHFKEEFSNSIENLSKQCLIYIQIDALVNKYNIKYLQELLEAFKTSIEDAFSKQIDAMEKSKDSVGAPLKSVDFNELIRQIEKLISMKGMVFLDTIQRQVLDLQSAHRKLELKEQARI